MLLKNSKLSHKMEDYLEAISFIEEKREVARVGEIAKDLGVNSSSVNVMMKMLAERGLIKHEKYGYIKLTKAGREIGEQVKARHRLLNNFLIKYLGVNHNTAAVDACGLEHSLSLETFTQLKKFISFLEKDKDHQHINIHHRIEEFSSKI
jgi:DtxR family transcriptional regulator, Mn-dependent transcriptional regulator